MRVDVSLKYIQNSELVEDVVDKNIAKIERRVKIYKRDDPIHVSVHIEKNPHKEQYFCRTHIYLPAHLLKAQGQGADLGAAVTSTFSALSKQLDRLKHKVESHLRRKGRVSVRCVLDEDAGDE